MNLPTSLLSLLLSLTGAWALQCYSLERVFTGPFDLSGLSIPTVTCGSRQKTCLEAVTSMSTGYGKSVTLVKKGCSDVKDVMDVVPGRKSLPPDYTRVRQCQEDLCNHQIDSQDSIPNLSPVPDPAELSGTKCWACISTKAEDCELQNSSNIDCYKNQSVCFQGQGSLNIGNFSTSIYLRTCLEPTCTVTGTTTLWSNSFLKGSCCGENFCNNGSYRQVNHVTDAPSSHAPDLVGLPLFLTISFLLGPLREALVSL
ncbi:ly6/PLAUR domain-containing protein 5-like [Monodelphis domestica]|uniref:ly6/PLAUR domain-containing protein 5-like n=1 Tax=Monodelphis domestica TaxID=13616 RepID=UPI0004436642|nr:ly6/PLAUR domain-containing protein 5-like [Monodelphis domestica]